MTWSKPTAHQYIRADETRKSQPTICALKVDHGAKNTLHRLGSELPGGTLFSPSPTSLRSQSLLPPSNISGEHSHLGDLLGSRSLHKYNPQFGLSETPSSGAKKNMLLVDGPPYSSHLDPYAIPKVPDESSKKAN